VNFRTNLRVPMVFLSILAGSENGRDQQGK